MISFEALTRRRLISLALTLLTMAVIVVFIAYQVVIKFSYATDNVYYGKSQIRVANEIREELLANPHCTPVSFTSQDNFKLQGLLFKRPNAIGNMLVCHGYKSCKEFMYGFVHLFPQYNVLVFDFRASGQSDGTYISLGYHEFKDVVAAASFLKKETSRELPFVILAQSMGGAAALRAASQYPNLADAFIIDSSFSDLRSMFLRGYSLRVGLPYYPFFPVIQATFHYFADCNVDDVNSLKAVEKIAQPILFIHSCDDNFITPDQSIQLYAQAKNSKSRVWIGPRCRHGWLHSYHPELYHAQVAQFLEETLHLKN